MLESIPLTSSADLRQAASVLDRLEAAWAEGKRPELEAFLPTDGPARPAILAVLACAELELRLKAKEPARVETYLDRFPELASVPSLLIGLIRTEWEQRHRLAEPVELQEYLDRFPGQREQILQLVAGSPTLSVVPTLPPPGTSSDASLPSLPGYEIIDLLGRGGMGVVYQARQTRFGRRVALKMIRDVSLAGPEGRVRFRAEAQALARLQHPNIVQVFEGDEQGGSPYFSLELVEGGNLARRFNHKPQLPREAAALLEVLRGPFTMPMNKGSFTATSSPPTSC